MVALTMHLQGDGCWPDLAEKLGTEAHLEALEFSVALLEKGMASGKPSVMMRVDLPDGKFVIVETSLVLFLTAADAFRARAGDPRL
jgi:hypothetical protein